MPVESASDFDKRPGRGKNVRCPANQFSYGCRVWLIHVVLCDIRGIQIHSQRSSSKKRPLSPATDGKRRQRSLMSGRRGLARLFEIGRSSATGSPRRSIRMTVPSAASRTNSEVRMWRSRIEAVFMCYIVALRDPMHSGRYAMRRRETVPRANQPGTVIQVSSLTGLTGRTASIKLTAASSKNRLDQFFRLTATPPLQD